MAEKNIGGINFLEVIIVDPVTGAPVAPATGGFSLPYTNQQKVTGGAVALPSHALVNGAVITASPTNTGVIVIGPAGVTATTDGTGSGYPLSSGQSCSLAISNLNLLFIIGATGFAATDFVSIIGN